MTQRTANTPRRLPSPTASTLFAALLAALLLLPLLGARPLTDWDEAIYAEVAREMLHFGPLVPHWNYQPWLEKPPLAMWLTAGLYYLLGVTNFAGRAVSALSAIGTVAVLHATLARARSLLAAWLSTGVLLGTFGFLHACHTGEVDTLLAFTCVLSVLGLARIPQAPSSGWLLFFGGFALAAMTKGAASVTLPLTALVLAVLPPRTLRLSRHIWPGLALFLLLVLPWHLAMLHRFGPLFLHEYLGVHVLARSTRQIEGHTTNWWFYAEVLLVAAPPFVLLYPGAIARALRPASPAPASLDVLTRNPTPTHTPGVQPGLDLRPWAVFALVTLALYTAAQTRLPQYIVPAYPALALLTAVFLAERLAPYLAARTPAAKPGRFWITRAAFAAVLSAALILLTAPARKSLHSAAPAAGGAAAPLDNKDAVALLRDAHRTLPEAFASTTGPLLLWRPARISSIAAVLFYARRPVQQLQLETSTPLPPTQPRDRYLFDPIPFDQAVSAQPRLLLLDRTLVPLLPPTFTYTPLADHGTMELGLLARRAPPPAASP